MSSRKKKSHETVSPQESIRTLLSAAVALSSTSLDLRNRELPQLCAEFSLLHRLEYLYLEGNLLEELPAEVVHGWRSLRWLDLRNNLLAGLPGSIGEIINLRTLLLAGNIISQLPPELGNLNKLTGLNLSGNPLTDPPRCVVEQGTRSVLSYLLKKQSQSQSNPIPEFSPRKDILIYPDKRAYPSEYPEECDDDMVNEMPPELTLRRAKLFAIRGMRNPLPKRFPSPANFTLYTGPGKPKMSSFIPRKKSILKKTNKELPSIVHKTEKRSLTEVINETAPVPPNTRQIHTLARLGDPASQARLVLNESNMVPLANPETNVNCPTAEYNSGQVLAQNVHPNEARSEQGVGRVANNRANRPKEAKLRREVKPVGESYEDKGYCLTPFTGGLDII